MSFYTQFCVSRISHAVCSKRNFIVKKQIGFVFVRTNLKKYLESLEKKVVLKNVEKYGKP